MARRCSSRSTGKPSWAAFDPVTGRLSGTPAASDVGSFGGIEISVSDGIASAALPAFSIAVTGGTAPGPTNRAPTISGTPAGSVAVGQAYSFTPTAADPDGQALTFSIVNKPSWATFNTATGRLNGTPAAGNVGSFADIAISVSDGAATTSLPAFTISVVATNVAPTIGGTPSTTVTAGQAYSFTPTAADPDGQALTFSIANKPSWATLQHVDRSAERHADRGPGGLVLERQHHRLGRRGAGDAGAVHDPGRRCERRADDQRHAATSVTAGQAYSFTPTAADPDGQALTFSIANKPSWATFNTSTGRLNGTPTAAQVGSYANVTIAVSDGTIQASLAPFTIVVDCRSANQPPTISGTPPTTVTAGQAYSFTPTRLRSGWPGPDVLDRQQAIVGDLQHVHRPAERHADHGAGRLVRQRDDLGLGRHGSGVACSIHDRGRHGRPCEPAADDQRLAFDLRHGRPGLQLHAHAPRIRTARPSRSRSPTSRRGRRSTRRPAG